MTQAEEVCTTKPTLEMVKMAKGLKWVSDHTQSDAFRFCRCPDGSLYEARYSRSGHSSFTPVDKAGRPLTDPAPAQAVGVTGGVSSGDDSLVAQRAAARTQAAAEPPRTKPGFFARLFLGKT